jgi:hypothetical protein
VTTLHVTPLAGHEVYEISTSCGDFGTYQGTVTGPFGTLAGDPYALTQLGKALLDAAASASFATTLRVDEHGVLRTDEQPVPDLTDDAAAALAREGWINTVLVWATAGDDKIPVEPGNWTADAAEASAEVDDHTDLHFANGRLTARSRCRHAYIHRRALEHPADLIAVRREALRCPGHGAAA